jgi:hypothetical protein
MAAACASLKRNVRGYCRHIICIHSVFDNSWIPATLSSLPHINGRWRATSLPFRPQRQFIHECPLLLSHRRMRRNHSPRTPPAPQDPRYLSLVISKAPFLGNDEMQAECLLLPPRRSRRDSAHRTVESGGSAAFHGSSESASAQSGKVGVVLTTHPRESWVSVSEFLSATASVWGNGSTAGRRSRSVSEEE